MEVTIWGVSRGDCTASGILAFRSLKRNKFTPLWFHVGTELENLLHHVPIKCVRLASSGLIFVHRNILSKSFHSRFPNCSATSYSQCPRCRWNKLQVHSTYILLDPSLTFSLPLLWLHRYRLTKVTYRLFQLRNRTLTSIQMTPHQLLTKIQLLFTSCL